MKKALIKLSTITLVLMLILCLPFVFACGEKEDTVNDAASAAVTTEAIIANEQSDDSPPEAITEPAVQVTTEPPPEEDVPDSGTAKLLKKDFDTKGSWIGNYGSDGYIIYIEDDSLESLPAYAKVDFADSYGDFPSVYTWWDSDSGNPAHDSDDELAAEREASALLKLDGASRIAACWYDGDYFSVIVNVGDTPKKVTLYMNDYDSYNRAADVLVKNKTGKAMKEPAEKVAFDIDEYVAGCYITYEISGEVMFEFHCFGGNVVLSGIFFDPA